MSVRLRDQDLSTPVVALVDSGSESILAAPWLASDIAANLADAKYVTDLGVGGGRPDVSFLDVYVRLQHPNGSDEDYIEWTAEVGFPDTWNAPWPVLLGLHGFFDRFTVSLHRSAALTVVEEWDVFDKRFGVEYGESDDHTPRRGL